MVMVTDLTLLRPFLQAAVSNLPFLCDFMFPSGEAIPWNIKSAHLLSAGKSNTMKNKIWHLEGSERGHTRVQPVWPVLTVREECEMWSQLRVFGMVFVTLDNFSSLYLPLFFPPGLQLPEQGHGTPARGCDTSQKASVASSGLLVLKGDFKFNLVERKVVPYCTMLIVTFHHVAFLKQPNQFVLRKGSAFEWEWKWKRVQCKSQWDTSTFGETIIPPSTVFANFSCLSGRGDLLWSITAVVGQRQGLHPGQVTTSSERWEDHDLLI